MFALGILFVSYKVPAKLTFSSSITNFVLLVAFLQSYFACSVSKTWVTSQSVSCLDILYYIEGFVLKLQGASQIWSFR